MKANNTLFKKGHTGYKGFLGRHHTLETRAKLSAIAKADGRRPIRPPNFKLSPESIERMRQSKLGTVTSDATKAKLSALFKGRKISEKQKEQIRQAHIGMRLSEETKHKIRLANLGKKHPEFSGDKHPCWKGGVTPLYKVIRKSPEAIAWRTAVFERDKFKCVECGIVGTQLHADHIKPFSLFPKLRFELSNGRTLCVPCHKQTDTYGYKAVKMAA